MLHVAVLAGHMLRVGDLQPLEGEADARRLSGRRLFRPHDVEGVGRTISIIGDRFNLAE